MTFSLTPRIYVLVLVLAAILVVVAEYVWVFPIMVLGAILSLFYWKEEFIPQAFIIAALVLVGDIIPLGRVVVNYAGFFVLIVYYVRKFGLSVADRRIFREPMYVWVIGMFIAFCISMVFSRYPASGLMHLLRMVVFFLIIHLLYTFLKHNQKPGKYIDAYLIVAFILSINVLYGFVTSGFSLVLDEVNALYRFSGLIENVNNLGTMLSIAVPFFFFRGYLSMDRRLKLTYYGIAGIVVFALFLTNTRSAFLIMIVYTPFFLYYVNKRALKIISVFGVVVLTAFFFIEELYQLMTLLFRLERIFSGREVLWDTSINIISDRWLFGIGPGAFRLESYNYLPVLIGSIGEEAVRFQMGIIEVGHAHNFYLFYFSEMGVGGLIIAVALPVVFLTIAFQSLKYFKNSNQEAYYTVLAVLGTGLGMFVRGLIEANNLATYGWLTGDLSFWMLFMINSFYYSIMRHAKKNENS